MVVDRCAGGRGTGDHVGVELAPESHESQVAPQRGREQVSDVEVQGIAEASIHIIQVCRAKPEFHSAEAGECLRARVVRHGHGNEQDGNAECADGVK